VRLIRGVAIWLTSKVCATTEAVSSLASDMETMAASESAEGPVGARINIKSCREGKTERSILVPGICVQSPTHKNRILLDVVSQQLAGRDY
jgi:hypothetical protein